MTMFNAATNVNGTTYQGVKIPVGFAPTGIEGESTVDEGLVITDSEGNEYVWIEVPKSIYTDTRYTTDLTADSEGNKRITSATDYDGIYKVLNKYASEYRKGSSKQNLNWKDEWYDSSNHIYDGTNWYTYNGTLDSNYDGDIEDKDGCGLTYNGYTIMYNKMLASVYTNGGFWIGRYEAGITSPRGSAEDTIDKINPLSKQNEYSINYVTCSQAQEVASRAQNIGSCNSSLMFGIQWDLVLKFIYEKEKTTNSNIESQLIEDSSTWGNYNNQQFTIDRGEYSHLSPWNNFISYTTATENKVSVVNGVSRKIGEIQDNRILLTTGASDTNSKKNIYDLAGNVWEWTLEHATSNSLRPCARHGGNFSFTGSRDPVSSRGNGLTTGSDAGVRFPCINILILKQRYYLCF